MATKYEYSAAGSGSTTIADGYAGQTFTPLITHRLTSIKLSLSYVTSSPGTVTVSIRNTQDGVPVGNDIVSGTMNGNSLTTSFAWYEITMSLPTIVYAGTQYAIVITATDVTKLGFQTYWSTSTDTYPRGSWILNTTGTWFILSELDLNFEEWGDLKIGGLFFCLG